MLSLALFSSSSILTSFGVQSHLYLLAPSLNHSLLPILIPAYPPTPAPATSRAVEPILEFGNEEEEVE